MKGSIKNIYKKIIKYPITVWMVVSIIALVSVYVVYSAYNGTAEVKRVVSTQETSNTVFSSNYLEKYSESNPSIKKIRTTTSGDFAVSITVCNYDQLNPSKPAEAAIEYSLQAELVKLNSGNYERVTEVQMNGSNQKTFTIQKKMNDNQTITGTDLESPNNLNATSSGSGGFSYTYDNESLPGGVSYKDTFEICFDATEVAKSVPDLYIRVTATPTPQSVTSNGGNISTLQSVISISQGRTVETGWHGSLQETSTNTAYDGYNLVIEGSGSGTIDIQWDATKFVLNPEFVQLYGTENDAILGTEGDVSGKTGWKYRTLTVDSNNCNRYVVQFYKRIESGATSPPYTGGEFPSKYIQCVNYVESSNSSPSPSPE